MNKHKNGTVIVGSKGSYYYLLSALEDMLKGKPKSFEVFHIGEHIKKEGLRIGLTVERMERDWKAIHNKVSVERIK